MKKDYKITKQYANFTIRRFIRTQFPHLNQSVIHKSLRNGDIRINNGKALIDHILTENDTINIWSVLTQPPFITQTSQPHQWEFLEELIIDRTDDYWCINKPYGLAVQGGTGLKTSVNYLLTGWMKQHDQTPHIVHRLDRHTTGVLLVSTNPISAHKLCSLFEQRHIHKHYLAICQTHKDLPSTGTIEYDIDHQTAITQYQIEQEYDQYKLISFYPVTGRKHQIRKHAAYIGAPICGDTLYYPNSQHDKLCLHAKTISCDQEFSFKYTATLHDHMKELISEYFSQ